jgi:hypothetical protein
MVYMVAIWLRGLVLRRQITDRKYRLTLRAAATKSASRSLRTYTSIYIYKILHCVVLALCYLFVFKATRDPRPEGHKAPPGPALLLKS